jgi:Ca2+-binding EF-hand superfamily protein
MEETNLQTEVRVLKKYLRDLAENPQDVYPMNCVDVIFHDWARRTEKGRAHRKEAVDELLKSGFVRVLKKHIQKHGLDGFVHTGSLNQIFQAVEYFYPHGPPSSLLKKKSPQRKTKRERELAKHLSDLLEGAYAAFEHFDQDSNGCISGDELAPVVDWLYGSFHGHGITKKKKLELKRKLLNAVDKDHDGRISFIEFERLFRKFSKRFVEANVNDEKKNKACSSPSSKNKKTMTLKSESQKRHENHVANILKSARKKFRSFDRDGDDYIDGSELVQVVQWLWRVFHVKGEKLPMALQARMVDKILNAIDHDHDGRITIQEFELLFMETAQRNPGLVKPPVVSRTPPCIKEKTKKERESGTMSSFKKQLHDRHVQRLMIFAKEEFENLDKDGSGWIDGHELYDLVDWLWKSFHVDGKPISQKRQTLLFKKVLDTVDTDHDGCISFPEFQELFLKYAERTATSHRGLNTPVSPASDLPASVRAAAAKRIGRRSPPRY